MRTCWLLVCVGCAASPPRPVAEPVSVIVPPAPAAGRVLARDLPGVFDLQVDGDALYWLANPDCEIVGDCIGELLRLPLAGGEPSVLAQAERGFAALSVEHGEAFVAVRDGDDAQPTAAWRSEVYRVEGGELELAAATRPLGARGPGVRGMQNDVVLATPDWLIWKAIGPIGAGPLVFAPRAGGEARLLYADRDDDEMVLWPRGVHDQHVVFVAGDRVLAVDPAGGRPVVLADATTLVPDASLQITGARLGPAYLVVDVRASDEGAADHGHYLVPLDGRPARRLTDPVLATDAQHGYWIDEHAGEARLLRRPLAGGAAELVDHAPAKACAGTGWPDVVLAGEAVIWYACGQIRRVTP